LEGDEFDALVKDIEDNGLREPITLYEDKILDGRNRYRAVVRAKLQYKLKEENFRTFTGSDPLGFVVSANIHRRLQQIMARSGRQIIIANSFGWVLRSGYMSGRWRQRSQCAQISV
jgi:hypothetical protein